MTTTHDLHASLRWARRPPPTALRVFVALCGGILLVLAAVSLWFPSWRTQLTAEDHFLENVEATLFLVSFGLGATGLFLRRRRRTERISNGVVAALGLLLFLEEISYGERIFSLTMPRVFGVKMDAAHDLLALAHTLLSRGSRGSAVAAALFCLASGAAVAGCLLWRRPPRAAGRSEPLRFVALCLGLVACAQVLDLGMIRADLFTLLEEALETQAALALVVAGAVALRDEPAPGEAVAGHADSRPHRSVPGKQRSGRR